MYAAVSVSRKNWRLTTYRNWLWHGVQCLLERELTEEEKMRRKKEDKHERGNERQRDTALRNGVLTRTWGYQISYRSNLARDSWESRRPCYSPQFPRTIASSCCCWPIGFSRITSRTYTHAHIHTYTSAASDSILHYRIEISYSRASTSNL